MYLTPDYEDMIALFNEHGVRYLVAGAYAMSTFGYSRSTYDIDLWIGRDESNIDKVIAALDDFGIPFQISAEDLSRPNSVIQIGTAPVRIDLLTDIDGVDFDDAYAGRIVHDFGTLQASVINLDDLMKNKSATQRSKDKIDLIELRKIKESSRD